MSCLIRAMRLEDLDRVLAIAGESIEAPRWTRQDYEQTLLAAPEALVRSCWIALSGTGAVGFAVASWLRQEPAAEVEGLVVERAFRRQGIGGALIAACMAWAANLGATTIRLEVRASNAAAIALYQRQGFSPAGVRRGYYSAPREDALLLDAPLFGGTPL
jgi:ribosomal-protein-alanine N-acetyltransferase